MATIGIILLIVFFVYVYHIFTKPYPPREKSIFLDYTKSGAKIPGMRTHRSKKRKR
jgi:preprotein translocase subunit SecY